MRCAVWAAAPTQRAVTLKHVTQPVRRMGFTISSHSVCCLQDAREARSEVSRLQARLRVVEAEKAEAASHLTQARALNDALQGQVCAGRATVT